MPCALTGSSGYLVRVMIIDSSKLVMIGLSLVVNMELFSITTNRTCGHHQALAGGTSISQLTEPYANPPGHHQALAGGIPTTNKDDCFVAMKLMHHRLKPGGV